MTYLDELKKKRETALKAADMVSPESDMVYDEGFHRGYAKAIQEVIDDIEERIPTDGKLEPGDAAEAAIIKTPANSIAMCVYTVNLSGELGEHPYSGCKVYGDANNKHWLVDHDGRILPFNLSMMEVIEETS